MTIWLTQVSAALEWRSTATQIFFRDDDAGWDRPRLTKLLDLFEQYETPIDLAVIPNALDVDLALELVQRRARHPKILGLHQHGFRHLNHEREGRKCEFGVSRRPAEQDLDLAAGRQRLLELLGKENVDNIFTPPWNRCTQATVECLVKQGFHSLSRNVGAAPLKTDGLVELPVHVDWCKAGGTLAEKRVTRGNWIAVALNQFPTVGIMLHHAAMDDEDFADIEQLLNLIKKNGESQCYSMSQLIEQGADAFTT